MKTKKESVFVILLLILGLSTSCNRGTNNHEKSNPKKPEDKTSYIEQLKLQDSNSEYLAINLSEMKYFKLKDGIESFFSLGPKQDVSSQNQSNEKDEVNKLIFDLIVFDHPIIKSAFRIPKKPGYIFTSSNQHYLVSKSGACSPNPPYDCQEAEIFLKTPTKFEPVGKYRPPLEKDPIELDSSEDFASWDIWTHPEICEGNSSTKCVLFAKFTKDKNRKGMYKYAAEIHIYLFDTEQDFILGTF